MILKFDVMSVPLGEKIVALKPGESGMEALRPGIGAS